MNDIIHRGETMLISISADDFPVTDLSDVVLTIKHGQQETQLHLEDFTLVTIPDTEQQEYQYLIGQETTLSWVSKAWHSDDGIITVVAHLEPESGGGEDPSEEATNAQKIGQLQTATAILQRKISGIASGTPPTASSTSEMDPDESTVYINTTDGNWYYYNGTAWTSGGTYGGAVTDTTLSISGAADVKAVGDALAGKADADDVTITSAEAAALLNIARGEGGS